MADQNKSKSSSELRRQRNLDLMRRMHGGESLNAYDSKASWFPPRPVIEKDEKEMSRVYKAKVQAVKSEKAIPVAATPANEGNVVHFIPQPPKRNRTFDEAG